MASKAGRHGEAWNRDELILAFDLYCRIPFKNTKHTNPQVRQLALLLDRTPASVARKLGNFGAFDPELAKRNITGLTHTSKLDREVWGQFHQDWNGLVARAFELRQAYEASARKQGETLSRPSGPSETKGMAKRRLHQAFFRETVLSSYDNTCCITGLSVPDALIASHIIPWSKSGEQRTNPCNGLCLSATFSRLFDAGLLTVEVDMRIKIGKAVLAKRDATTRQLVSRYDSEIIRPPARFLPDPAFLEWHVSNVFNRRQSQ